MSVFFEEPRPRRSMSAWCGTERPLSYRRRCRLRAQVQYMLKELTETREAVRCVQRLLVAFEGSDYWEVFEPLPAHAIYRPYLEQHRVLTRSEKKYLKRRGRLK